MLHHLVSRPFDFEIKSNLQIVNPRMKAFLTIQTRAAELLLGEITLPGSPLIIPPDPSASLAETISAVKSLIDTLLSAEPGQEPCFTMQAWITLGYGLSLGVKLDILCTTCGISPATANELRRNLDIASFLQRPIDRMRMSIAHSTDEIVEGPHPLCQFLSRAEAVQRWYARHGPPAATNSAMSESQDDLDTFTNPGKVHERWHSLSTHSYPGVGDDALLGQTNNQDLGFAYDPDMLAFEGLDFEGMNFTMDSQEAWNPFVFPDGAY